MTQNPLASLRRKLLGKAESRAEPTIAAAAPSAPRRWAVPDFQGHLWLEQRVGKAIRTLDTDFEHPRRLAMRKLYAYRFAASHGLEPPRILASWDDPRQADFSDLGPAFVLKCDAGSTGASVWPVRRAGESFAMVASDEVFSAARLRDEVAAAGAFSAPLFAEELLSPDSGSGLPADVKIYSFYGQVGHVMVRQMPRHRDLTVARFRYADADGNDLGKITPQREVDPTIPLPTQFDAMVEWARTLSLAAPFAFVRVDLYQAANRVIFGEMTTGPGGKQGFTSAHGRHLGEMWESARARLELDLARGRPFGWIHGASPVDHIPLPGPVSRRRASG